MEKTWVLPPAPRSKPVHPTQVYSAINALLMCLFLWAFYAFRTRDGQVIALLLTIYPVARSLLEIIRNDEGKSLNTNVTISTIVSFFLLALVIGLWAYVATRPRGTAWPATPAAT